MAQALFPPKRNRRSQVARLGQTAPRMATRSRTGQSRIFGRYQNRFFQKSHFRLHSPRRYHRTPRRGDPRRFCLCHSQRNRKRYGRRQGGYQDGTTRLSHQKRRSDRNLDRQESQKTQSGLACIRKNVNCQIPYPKATPQRRMTVRKSQMTIFKCSNLSISNSEFFSFNNFFEIYNLPFGIFFLCKQKPPRVTGTVFSSTNYRKSTGITSFHPSLPYRAFHLREPLISPREDPRQPPRS